MSDAHTHGDIEINYVLGGSMRYFFAGRFETVAARELAVFWAGIPHELVDLAKPTTAVWATIPLAWVLQWPVGERLRRRLLGGELIKVVAERDAALLEGWAADFRQAPADLQEIVLLEVQARLRRLGRDERSAGHAPPGAGHWVERVTRVIGQRYTDRLTVADIAAAVELHPNYLMRVFKQQSGMSLWEYVLRLRLSHAQRLLVTSDRKIVDIALASGFGSVARFYETFRRIAACSPRSYRRKMGGQQGAGI